MHRFLGSVLLLLAAGCESVDTANVVIDTVPVSGIATYQGKPLEDYRVYFNNMGDRTATGMVDAQGHFVLGTNEPGDGAPPGKHFVWFVYSPNFEAEPGNEGQAPPPPKVSLPKKYTQPMKSGITVEVPDEGLTDYKLELK